MKRALLAIAAMLLACCGQNGTPSARDAASDNSLSLSCEAFASMTGQALVSTYGVANVDEQTLPGVEGDSYTATIVYPNDPARRLEIVWRDPAARDAPASVIVNGQGSLWEGPNNLSIGDALADVERANGQPFQLWGFGWDYGGWVSDWEGGTFAAANGCNIRVRFAPRADDKASAIGETSFMSNDDAVRAAEARVSQFGLLFQRSE